ncbi:MAG: toprim domain-containing protein [Nanoarchaeota archaeon]
MEIKEILNELGYNLKDYGKRYRTKPIYRDSNNATSLSIDKNTGSWYDFSEETGGSFEDLICKTLNLKTRFSARSWLKNKDFCQIKKETKPLIKKQKIFPEEFLKELFPIHNYWIKRGIEEKTINLFKGGICYEGQLNNRYVFPIFNYKKQIVGFSGRDIINSDRPKWKHLGDVDKWCYPTFLNFDYVWNGKEIILIESIGDMLSLWQAGIKNTLVLFGLNLSNKRFNFLIKSFPKKILISLNNDINNQKSGQKAANKIYSKLEKYFDKNQIVIKLPNKKDFGEMTTEEIIEWKK